MRTFGTSSEVSAGARQGTLIVDVTDIVRAIVDGEIEDHGLMLLPAIGDRAGFSADEAELLGDALDQAVLRIYFRDMQALGYEGGMKALLDRSERALAGDR